jgi:acyl-coenzyme A synthetase/AMP-(fatty) acid ligase
MNIAEIIAGHALSQPSKVAIDTGSDTITYAAFDGMVQGIAADLRRHDVGVGDVVAVRLRDTSLHVAVLVGVLRVGAVVLPIDWRAAPAEIEKIVQRFTPRVIVADDEGLPSVAVPVLRPQVTRGDPTSPAPLNGAAMAYAMTSGTTGEPKVFRLTHEAYHARVMQFRDSSLILPTDRLLGPIPMAYAAGREMALGLMLQGATFLMLPPLHTPAEFVAAANDRGATVALVSPNITRALLGYAEGARARLLPRLRLYINATAKAEPDERERIVERIAPAVADMYGSTGAGLISIIHGSEHGSGRTSVGRPGPGITVEVAGDDYRPLPPDAIGRVRVRGLGVVTEFVGDVAFGDEGIRDGWYYPGDIGSFDTDGFLHLHDRAADLIKRGGVMIHAQEVEHVLRIHPAVVDAAVVGIPSPTLGQEVAAFVVARGAPPQAAAIVTFCRERLAGHKAPSRVVFVRELPRNANGKVVKADLAKLA